MSRSGAVEVPGVTMPMIDDQPERLDDDERVIPRSLPPLAAGEKSDAPPKSVREAYIRMKNTREVGELCGILTICCTLVCAGICMTIFLVAVSLLHIYLLVIGIMHLHDCPAERFIPIFLIVTAVFTILRAILNWYYTYCHRKVTKQESNEQVAPRPSPFSNIINLFLFVWFICGAVWVFRANVDTFDDRNSPHYCDKLTYYTAYIYIIASLVVMALSLMLACCLCYCVVCAIAITGAGDTTESGIKKRGDGGV